MYFRLVPNENVTCGRGNSKCPPNMNCQGRKLNSCSVVPYRSIYLMSIWCENQYLIKFPFISTLISGCFGRRQRDTKTGAVGHSFQKIKAWWVTASLSHWNVQPRLSLSNLTIYPATTMAPSHITEAYYSTVWTEYCVYSLYACVTRATGSTEPWTSSETQREWTLWAVLSTKRCTCATSNRSHKGARSRARLWQGERHERKIQFGY